MRACSPVDRYWRFGRTYCLHLQDRRVTDKLGGAFRNQPVLFRTESFIIRRAHCGLFMNVCGCVLHDSMRYLQSEAAMCGRRWSKHSWQRTEGTSSGPIRRLSQSWM
jgi:hypothetical protein